MFLSTKKVEKKNLKMVGVHGDRNCFLRAIAHQLCYNEFRYEQTR